MKALSEYQQAVLDQLDIVQWRLRTPVADDETRSPPVTETAVVSPPVSVETSPEIPQTNSEPEPQLVDRDSAFAKDVALAVELLQQIARETLNWQVGESIQINAEGLVTPDLEQLHTQPQLKKQLWNALQQWQK
ncbi:hypothetical protein [Neptunicella sp. SCSIO 80796]|uniref:hypothetical protein n=1 Tax=Neptunicella plasticusilytica TaxID=3117012 RepID=UPI003A4DA804